MKNKNIKIVDTLKERKLHFNRGRNSVGITLVALVITIVVLIILAGVLINISLGNNGLFNKAKTAKEMYTNAQDYEEEQIAKYSNEIDNIISTRLNNNYSYLGEVKELNKKINLPNNFDELYVYCPEVSLFVVIPKICLKSTEQQFRNAWVYDSYGDFLSVTATTEYCFVDYAFRKGDGDHSSSGIQFYYR